MAFLVVSTALGVAAMSGPQLRAERQGAPAGRVGICGFGPTCSDPGNGCHFSAASSPTLSWEINFDNGDALPPFYEPDIAYSLRLVVDDPMAWYIGFQLAPLISCPVPENGGTILATDAVRTRIVVDGFDIDYLTHRCICPGSDAPECCGFVPEVLASGHLEWAFDWIAPARGTGDVEFRFAFNSADGDGAPSNDVISPRFMIFPEEPCPEPITDLMVRLAECDPGAPGVAHVELSWTPSGAATTWIRSTDDEAMLALGPGAWPALPEGCVPMSGRDLVFFSIAESCQLGGEGVH